MKIFDKWLKPAPSAAKPPAGDEEAAFTAEEPASAAAAEETPLMGHNRRVLVVDDNPVVLKAFEMKLNTLGFKVFTAADGASAVSCAREEKPDVIVLDINFPDTGSTGLQWSGFTIMQWMHRFKEAVDIPVIVITSDDPAKCKDKALASGASAFFQKPINHNEFLVTLRRLIGQNAAKVEAA